MNSSDSKWMKNPFVREFVALKVRQLDERARRAGYEPEDIRAELLSNLWRRRANYNPARGRWTTFVRLVTENHIADMMARWSRTGPPLLPLSEQRGAGLEHLLHERIHEHRTGTSSPDALAVWQLSADLSDVLGRLTRADRRLCHELSLHSVMEVARRLGCSVSTVYRRIHRIRSVFERFGMQAYLGDCP